MKPVKHYGKKKNFVRTDLRYSNASKISAAYLMYLKVEYNFLLHCGYSFLTTETLTLFLVSF